MKYKTCDVLLPKSKKQQPNPPKQNKKAQKCKFNSNLKGKNTHKGHILLTYSYTSTISSCGLLGLQGFGGESITKRIIH